MGFFFCFRTLLGTKLPGQRMYGIHAHSNKLLTPFQDLRRKCILSRGEVLCMRAWYTFTLVRIIYTSLVTVFARRFNYSQLCKIQRTVNFNMQLTNFRENGVFLYVQRPCPKIHHKSSAEDSTAKRSYQVTIFLSSLHLSKMLTRSAILAAVVSVFLSSSLSLPLI